MKNANRGRMHLISYGIIPLMLLFFVGCASSSTGGTGGNMTHAAIDWVNFVRFGGITYLTPLNATAGRALQTSDIGSVFATVTHRLDGNVQKPNYHAQDGDAAFLNVGTKLYRLKHYAPTFRLVTYVQGSIQLYEADTNSQAKHGADLLDIAGKVQFLDINSPNDGTTVLATIRDAKQIMSLISMILSAPVNQQTISDGTRYFLVFHLMDGTTITRVFWPDTGELSRGIILPQEFAAVIKSVVR